MDLQIIYVERMERWTTLKVCPRLAAELSPKNAVHQVVFSESLKTYERPREAHLRRYI